MRLISLIVVMILFPAGAASQEPTKRVLILSGSDPNFPGFSIITGNIVSTLRGSWQSRVEVLYEVQEGLVEPPVSPGSDEELASYMKRKYADRKLDLILSLQAPRLLTVLQKSPGLFGNVPKIFYEFESEREAINRALGPNITGVWRGLDQSKTLELALALLPDTRKVVAVYGNGAPDSLRRETAQVQFRKYEKRAEFSYIKPGTIEELKGELAALDKGSVVIFLIYTRDKAGNRYSGPEVISVIAPASKAPIFGYSDTYMGLGVTGGNLQNFEATGRRVGEMGLRVLAGERPETIPQEIAPTVMTLDWRELQRWGIREQSLPPGSVVKYKAASFWALYKWYIVGLVAAIVVEALLIAGLLISRSRRRLAEEENEKLAAIVESSDDAIWSKSLEGTVTSWNRGAERLYGYSASEIIGQPVSTLAPADQQEEIAEIMKKIGRGESVDHLETVRLTKDGRRIDVSLTVSPIKDAHRKFVGAATIARDMTASKKAEAEAIEQRAELAHLSRVTMLGELSGSLAHELNQPLTAILSNAQAAQRFLAHDDIDRDELREILSDIVDQDKRAGEVIHRLRLLLKKGEVERQSLDVNSVVQEVLKLIRGDLANQSVTTLANLGSHLPNVQGDRVQLQQVLLNLVMNACDAMNRNAPTDRQIVISTETADSAGICISVSDRGPGVAAGKLEQVFEPFITSKAHGLGLGLPICRSIIAAHGGRLWAINNAERGATFNFTLPVTSDQ